MWFFDYGVHFNPGVYQLGFNFIWYSKHRMITAAFLIFTFHIGFVKKNLTLVSMKDIVEYIKKHNGDPNAQ